MTTQYFRRLVLLLLVGVSFGKWSGAHQLFAATNDRKTQVIEGDDIRPRNIILFIGDGMGVSQITAGKYVNGKLNLERFKTVGLVTTHASDDMVTDSAAAGTALATGEKTYNTAISVSPSKKPLKTVFEYAKEVGKATGLVVTCSVTHATPAVFVAHVDSRKKDNEIAEQIAASDIDVLIGGGLAYFVPQNISGSLRKDNKDLFRQLSEKMTVVHSIKAMRALGEVDRLAVFYAAKHPGKFNTRKASLAELTQRAIQILSKRKQGFILMVEGSQIDWAGHGNDTKYLVGEMIDFDQAVGVGLDFAKQNKKTLVVVTADHETGGFAITGGVVEEKKLTSTKFVSHNHTATMVPVFAAGVGAKSFAGIQDNTHIGKQLIQYVKDAKQ